MNKVRFKLSLLIFVALLSACLVTMHFGAITKAAQSATQGKNQPPQSKVQAQQDQAQPAYKMSDKKPLGNERLNVYRDFLTEWRHDAFSTLNISTDLDTLDRTGSNGNDGCFTEFDAEVTPTPEVHEFSNFDSILLGTGKINLVDPDVQIKDVEKNDPRKTVNKGVSVDNAVQNGFDHGLFTFSEIQFDKNHEKAIFSYSFYCGQECGNGGTVVMTRSVSGVWVITSRCQQWIAAETPTVKQVTKPSETRPFKIEA